MSRTRTIWMPAAAAALALGLTACGSGDGGGPGGGDLTWEDSPLAEFFTTGEEAEFDQEAEEARYAQESARLEQLVAECMAEQGFEYTPNDSSGSISFGTSMDEDYDPVENARQNGYGFFTWEDQVEDPQEEYVDPNQDYVESMSESERDAFYEALNGPMVEYDENAEMETEWNWEEAGCYGSAQHQVYDVESEHAGTTAVYSDPRWEELMTAMSATYEQAQSDPRMTAINQEWATCMADAGHADFATPQEAMESIMNLQNSFWEDHQDDPEYTGPTDEETAAAKEQELALATADYTCQEETDLATKQMRVQFEIEQEFVDENRAELEAFSEALAGAER